MKLRVIIGDEQMTFDSYCGVPYEPQAARSNMTCRAYAQLDFEVKIIESAVHVPSVRKGELLYSPSGDLSSRSSVETLP